MPNSVNFNSNGGCHRRRAHSAWGLSNAMAWTEAQLHHGVHSKKDSMQSIIENYGEAETPLLPHTPTRRSRGIASKTRELADEIN